MNNARFATIILAAGTSQRMGELKPLLPLGNTTIADYVISTFRSIGVKVFFVAGYNYEKIISGIKTPRVNIIYNADFNKGMLSSIQAGIRQLGNDTRAFFIQPVDIPLVEVSTIEKLIEISDKNPRKIIYPVFNGRRGHPPLIPADLVSGILNWQNEGGLRSFLKLYENISLEVAVNDDSILFDIDTPEDYQELLKRYLKMIIEDV